MGIEYPNDDDGDALRQVAVHGADMSRPMKIEFTIEVPTIECARLLTEQIAASGYMPDLYVDPESGAVSLYCARSMLATYEGVVAAQVELNELCEPVGAHCDGWITAGNRSDLPQHHSTGATTSQGSGDVPWESTQRTYEGFPLYLRRPIGLNFEALSSKLTVLMTLTHELSFHRFDGSPEPAYHLSLRDFDLAVTRYFSHTHQGQIVLVETFGGKRHYYFYVSPSLAARSILADLRERFPGYKLAVESSNDPGWDFIKRYTAEHIDEA